MTIEGTDHRIAETIVQNTRTHDQQILTMDSMQSTTAGDVENGASYLSIMESNLEVLREALKQEGIIMALLTARDLSLGYDSRVIVRGVLFQQYLFLYLKAP